MKARQTTTNRHSGKSRNGLLLVVLLATAASLSGCYSGATIVTDEEYAPVANAEFDELDRGSGDPDAPRIRVVLPSLGAPIGTPMEIDVRFEPAGDATIDEDSARVVYRKGFLTKDITETIREHGRIDASGIYCAEAKIPAGKHRIVVEVGDSKGRVGVQDMRFTVSRP